MLILFTPNHTTRGRTWAYERWPARGAFGRRPSGCGGAVEAEGELVEVGLEVGVAGAGVGPDEPSLEVPEGPVNARQQLLRAVRRSLKAGPVAVAERAERGVALPGVG